MMTIKRFVFNAFQENTYIIYDESSECIIVDPGCFEDHEKEQFADFITEKKLKAVKLINTHSHVDHILGNNFVTEKYGLKPYIHEEGLDFHQSAHEHGMAFGLMVPRMAKPEGYLKEGEEICFGKSRLKVLYTPGHVDGHICLISNQQKFAIVGDVLFQMSIGRTDLPTGDYDLLMDNIKNKLFLLPDDTSVYPGHGPETTIGFEKLNNPFLG